MIVHPIFEGDDDDELMWQQHDCYYEAVRIISHRSLEHYRAALRIVGQDLAELERVENHVSQDRGFDHRTLQVAHDIIAGYWRWNTGRHEPFLKGLEPGGMDEWKRWLESEIDSWRDSAWLGSDSKIIKYAVHSFLFQNTKQGYEAEHRLLISLVDRYSDMPFGADGWQTVAQKVAAELSQNNEDSRTVTPTSQWDGQPSSYDTEFEAYTMELYDLMTQYSQGTMDERKAHHMLRLQANSSAEEIAAYGEFLEKNDYKISPREMAIWEKKLASCLAMKNLSPSTIERLKAEQTKNQSDDDLISPLSEEAMDQEMAKYRAGLRKTDPSDAEIAANIENLQHNDIMTRYSLAEMAKRKAEQEARKNTNQTD